VLAIIPIPNTNDKTKIAPPILFLYPIVLICFLPSGKRWQGAYHPTETLNQTVLKELSVLWDKAMYSISVLITHMSLPLSHHLGVVNAAVKL
jgi:hypothetical protein